MESSAQTIVTLDWEGNLGRRQKVFRMLYTGLLKSSKLRINFDAFFPHYSLARRGTKLEDSTFAHIRFIFNSLDGTLSKSGLVESVPPRGRGGWNKMMR